MAPASSAHPFPDTKLSSAVPAKVTGEDKDLNLTNMDLAMKLHYIKAVYFFSSDAAQGLTPYDLKAPLFPLLERYYPAGGRIRRSEESGRPFIKCNDGGVRLVEAKCDKSMAEWLEKENVGTSLHHSLAYNQLLGPDLGFSPFIFIQFTWFRCGGLSVGLSWAHVLGDVFSASAFINTWADLLSGHVPNKPLHVPDHRWRMLLLSPPPPSTPSPGKPLFIKKVDPVGDCWIAAGNGKTETYSFHITAVQLRKILSNSTSDPTRAAGIPSYELICGMLWKSLANVNADSSPRVVTICENNIILDRRNEAPSNGMKIDVVESEVSIENCDLIDVAKLIREKRVPVNDLIEGVVGGDGEEADFIFYGANLTFVNLEGADVYGVKLKGHKAVMANFTISGVGDEGVVLVLPGPGGEEVDMMITVVLPMDQIEKLKDEIYNNWGLM